MTPPGLKNVWVEEAWEVFKIYQDVILEQIIQLQMWSLKDVSILESGYSRVDFSSRILLYRLV